MAPTRVLKDNKENQFRPTKKQNVATREKKIGSMRGKTDLHRENIPPHGVAVPMAKRAREKSDLTTDPSTVTKRSAFGDLTNAFGKAYLVTNKKSFSKLPPANKKPIVAKKAVEKKPVVVVKEKKCTATLNRICDLPCSQDSLKSSQGSVEESTAYETASESSPDENHKELSNTRIKKLTRSRVSISQDSGILSQSKSVPEGVVDFDKENTNDPFQCTDYVMDIFNYHLIREKKFAVKFYMSRQKELTRGMRAILIDWMVEIQESFELNHETMYLAVSLVDIYLSKVEVRREYLQLVGATAIFVACKFDERCPPPVDDFLYICDDAFTRDELLKTERNLLKSVDFDLGMPLSYRFLRRYARCAKLSMDVLTLSRYILELSLQEYELVEISPSVKASAALLLALQMKNLGSWTPTLQHYSGYSVADIKETAKRLNGLLHNPKENLKNIRTKYSHKVFFEVALTPLLEDLTV